MPVRKVEQELDRLSALRAAPEAEAAAGLSKAFSDRVNVIVARAAKIAGERMMTAVIPQLIRAYDRLFENERDPQCWAKNAIAQCLVDLGHRDPAVFVRGIRHIQMEAVWGGREDTATTLRSICALALPACSAIDRGDVLRLLADILVDKADPVRVDAVRAIAAMGGEEAILLLRLKARISDAAPQVIGQIFDCLFALDENETEAHAFVASFLKSTDTATFTEAALSLGSCRRPRAVELLIERGKEAQDPDLKSAILRGLAVSRQESAIEFLLTLVKDGRARDAIAALEALSVASDTEEIRKRAAAAAADREPEVRDALARALATTTR